MTEMLNTVYFPHSGQAAKSNGPVVNVQMFDLLITAVKSMFLELSSRQQGKNVQR